MAIEGIKPNVINPVNNTRVSEPVVTDNEGSVHTSSPTEVTPVISRQTGYESKDDKDKNKDDDEKNISEVSPEKVKSAIAEINKKIKPTHTQCEFKYHEKTKRISITVRDSDTDEVVREIPPEKTLDVLAKTLELAGILVDVKR